MYISPLQDLKVNELGDYVAAPYCGQILADLGADVIKIERPLTGDPLRQLEEPAWLGMTPSFAALNRNKRSAIVDLQDSRQLDALKGLIHESDVLLHNLFPGSAVKFGLDGESLIKINPLLVYCCIGAFGARGPLSKLPGYDPLMQAFGGIMSVTGEADGEPVRAGVPLVDCTAGMWAAIGIVSALHRRRTRGIGGIVDTSLFESSLALMCLVSANTLATGEMPSRLGSGSIIAVPYKAYHTADGRLLVACANDRLFAKLCAELGRSEWASDARFATAPQRLRNRSLLDGLIECIMVTDLTQHWSRRLEGAGIPNAPIQNINEVHEHAQTAALGMLLETGIEGMKLMGTPLSFEGERPSVRRGIPEVGQHTKEIFTAINKYNNKYI